MRSFLFIVLLFLIPANVQADPQDSQAGPLQDQPNWDKYDAYRTDSDFAIKMAKGMGALRVLALAEKDVVQWWVFGVPAGTPVASIQLQTTEGTYLTDYVVFSCKMSFSLDFAPTVANGDCECFRSSRGIRSVIAFAHFPEEPKGDFIEWTLEP